MHVGWEVAVEKASGAQTCEPRFEASVGYVYHAGNDLVDQVRY